LSRRPGPQTAAQLAERIVWLARAEVPEPSSMQWSEGSGGRPVADRQRFELEQRMAELALPSERDAEWGRWRGRVAVACLTDAGAPPLEPALRERVLQAAESGSPDLDALIGQAIADVEDARLLKQRLAARLAEARRELGVARALPRMLQAAGLGTGDARLANEV